MLKTDLQSINISGSTRLFGLIGDPVEHSKSPVFWNRAFAYLGLDCAYVAMQVKPENFRSTLIELQALNFRGINITMPLKNLAANSCTSLIGASDLTGCVNTIKFSGHEISGWNTDATGMLKILKNCRPIQSATIMGDGASSRSVLWALQQLPIKRVFQVARSCQEKVQDNLIGQVITRMPWNNKNFAYTIKESDIIFNTTPLGWKKEDFVIELEEFLDQNKIYADLNYAPYSRLLASARKTGCKVLDGRDLLFEQGLESFRILTETEPPQEIIRDCIFGQQD